MIFVLAQVAHRPASTISPVVGPANGIHHPLPLAASYIFLQPAARAHITGHKSRKKIFLLALNNLAHRIDAREWTVPVSSCA